MNERWNYYRVLFCIAILVFLGALLVGCGRTKPTLITASPLSPIATPLPATTVSSSSGQGGQIYVAQFYGIYASGYPYPVFFFEAPQGMMTLTLREVSYETNEGLKGVHPRLGKVVQEVAWPGGKSSQISATDFRYDEAQGLLTAFNVMVDNILIESERYDALTSRGIGVAYLGDTGGVNIFHNCGSSTSINSQNLNMDGDRPTESLFKWSCGDSSYEARIKMTWGTANSKTRVINGLTAQITRK